MEVAIYIYIYAYEAFNDSKLWRLLYIYIYIYSVKNIGWVEKEHNKVPTICQCSNGKEVTHTHTHTHTHNAIYCI